MKQIWVNRRPHKGEVVIVKLDSGTSIVGFYGGYDEKREAYEIFQVKEGDDYSRAVYASRYTVYNGEVFRR